MAGSVRGRGRNYARWRGGMESIQRLVYRGDWLARLWAHVPGTTRVGVAWVSIPWDRPPLRLGFVCDLHIGPTTPVETLRNAADALADAHIDVLALGGDYVFLDATPDRMRLLTDLISRIPARTRVAVLGNHDLWTDQDAITRALEEAGVSVLVNQSLRLPSPHDDVAILGLDDPWTGNPNLPEVEGVGYRIGLNHSPSAAFIVKDRVDLLICGHTHGGQIALPGGRPIITPPGAGCREWVHGRYQVGHTHLFVSRGVGSTELPIRVNAMPEVLVVELGHIAGGSS